MSNELINKFNDTLEILQQTDINSPKWKIMNSIKANLLEELKPSTREKIVYFKEEELSKIKEGFMRLDKIPYIPFYIGKRSLLEYNPMQRHPIPYVIVRCNEKYFFILRENGSGEMRLIGKKGLIGGHVGEEDVYPDILSQTLTNGLMREIKEEAGITPDKIKNIKFHGTIKNNEGIDKDHLGFVYEVEVFDENIKSEEDGVIKGLWLHLDELEKEYDNFESWAKIVYDNIIKRVF